MNQNMIEFYGQDDWRVSPRLTVNLGVRYSYFAQPSDNSKELSNFDPKSLFNPFYEETIIQHRKPMHNSRADVRRHTLIPRPASPCYLHPGQLPQREWVEPRTSRIWWQIR